MNSIDGFKYSIIKKAMEVYKDEFDHIIEPLNTEMELIEKCGYIEGFEIISIIVSIAKEKNIIFNYRGTIAGSYVAYVIGLTGVNPYKYGLPLECVYGVDIYNAPVAIIEFSGDSREIILKELQKKYDKRLLLIESGSQSIFIGKLAVLKENSVAFDSTFYPSKGDVYNSFQHIHEKEINTVYNKNDFVRVDILCSNTLAMKEQLIDKAGDINIPMEKYIPDVMSLFNDTEKLNIDQSEYPFKYGYLGLEIPINNQDILYEVLSYIKPDSFDDLIKVLSIVKSNKVWDKICLLIRFFGFSVWDIPTTQEDLIKVLLEDGADSVVVEELIDRIKSKKGVRRRDVYSLFLSDAKKWIEYYLEDIVYLPSKSHIIKVAKDVIEIGYYKLYHPKEFYNVYFDMYTDLYGYKYLPSVDKGIRNALSPEKNGHYLRLSDREEIALYLLMIEANMRNIVVKYEKKDDGLPFK